MQSKSVRVQDEETGARKYMALSFLPFISLSLSCTFSFCAFLSFLLCVVGSNGAIEWYKSMEIEFFFLKIGLIVRACMLVINLDHTLF